MEAPRRDRSYTYREDRWTRLRFHARGGIHSVGGRFLRRAKGSKARVTDMLGELDAIEEEMRERTVVEIELRKEQLVRLHALGRGADRSTEEILARALTLYEERERSDVGRGIQSQ